MTVKEYLVLQECDYDIEDKYYDTSVTCCYIDEITNSYEKFCDLLTSKVALIKGGDYPVANWSGLVKQNMEKFKDFSKKHWRSVYDNNENEFLYQWVKEFHCYLAGMVSEKFYDTLVEFFESLEPATENS